MALRASPRLDWMRAAISAAGTKSGTSLQRHQRVVEGAQRIGASTCSRARAVSITACFRRFGHLLFAGHRRPRR